MNSRQNVSPVSDGSVGIKKPSSKIVKFLDRPALGLKKPFPGNGGFHGNCVKLPSKEIVRPSSGKIKSPHPKFSTTFKKPVPSQKLIKQANLKPIDVSNPAPLKSQISLSQEDLKQLASKFDQLSASILQLATSAEPLGVRSLEALLTRQISDSLGDAINNPKFSQGFIKATRNLLDSLVCLYEEGKVNPKLIKHQRFSTQPFLRANSNTSLWDRYIKELVMNTLQSMCTDMVEAEVSRVVPVQSTASKERVKAIRDMVRVEAGIEPIAFSQLEKRLADLRRTFSQNQLVMLRAAEEVERVISQHLFNHRGCCDSRSSSDCVKIPEAAIESLRGKRSAGNDEDAISVPKTKDEEFVSRHSDSLSKNFFRDSHYNQSSPDVQCLNSREKGENRVEYDDILENIRPQIQKIAEDELLRVQEKSKLILKQERKSDKELCLKNSLESSSDEVDLENMIDYKDDDDEDDKEDTRMLLEALKKDMKQNLAMKMMRNDFNKIMEKINEDDEEISLQETKVYLEALKRDKIKNKTLSGKRNGSIHDSEKPFEKLLDEEEVLPFTTNVALEVPPRNFGYANFEIDSNTLISKFQMSEKVKEFQLQRLKSKWWLLGGPETDKIIKEMNLAFESFETTDYSLENVETNKQTTGNTFEKESSVIFKGKQLEFTIDEMAQVLTQLSTKICQLPAHLNDEKDSVFTITQKNKMFNVLKTLATFFTSNSYPTHYDFGTSLKDETQLLLLTKTVSSSFYFLSEKLVQTPSHLKNKPFSFLKPPESLTKSLAVLASTGYFKDCFIYTVAQRNYNTPNRALSCTNHRDKAHFGKWEVNEKTELDTFGMNEKVSNTQFTNKIEDMKPYNMDKRKSSEEIVIKEPIEDVDKKNIELYQKMRKTFTKKINKSKEVAKHLTKFEHYLGLSTSVMKVQDVSDMFLFLSVVLNDVPDRVKSEKILSLKPPSTLLRALDILYSASDDALNNVEINTSFDSLTVQNTSDFFLTLSKTFQDMPPRLKNAAILKLNPPQSLLRVINLLTSLSHNSVLDSRSQEEVEEETVDPVTNTHKVDSQEKFFDAVNSLTSLEVND